MSTKNIIGQQVLCYDSVVRIAKLLDQLCDGLRDGGLLKVVRAFPEIFSPLFTYTACVGSKDVLEAIDTDDDNSDISWKHFQ